MQGQKRLDLAGKQFGRLTAIEDVGMNKYHYRLWRCRCVCGKHTIVMSSELKNGHVRSCGCLNRDVNHQRAIHSLTGSRLYATWQNMKGRCHCAKRTDYQRYGAKGITVCPEWRNSFVIFNKWAVENGYDKDKTIERLDNSKGYFPENCTFIDKKFQSRNRSRCINLTIGTKTQTLSAWAIEKKIKYDTLRDRYHRGVSIQEMFKVPYKCERITKDMASKKR